MPQIASAHKSLALATLLRQLPGDRQPKILDLGPAVGANISMLAGLGCRIWVADLFRSLRAREGEDVLGDLGSLDRLLHRNLPESDDDGYDLILTWDLLNYFRPEELTVLGRHLARVCREQGTLFAMIALGRQMPDRPMRFGIADAEHLTYDTETAHRKPSPQYKQPDLERLMPGFEVETSFLLRSGIQEYVLALVEEPDEAAFRFDPSDY